MNTKNKNQDKEFTKLINSAIYGIFAGGLIAWLITYFFLKEIFYSYFC